MPTTDILIGIFQGFSKLLLGRIKADLEGALEVSVGTGDVLVLPAGTAHFCLESTSDYRYIGVYPEVSDQEFSSKSCLHRARCDTHPKDIVFLFLSLSSRSILKTIFSFHELFLLPETFYFLSESNGWRYSRVFVLCYYRLQ